MGNRGRLFIILGLAMLAGPSCERLKRGLSSFFSRSALREEKVVLKNPINVYRRAQTWRKYLESNQREKFEKDLASLLARQAKTLGGMEAAQAVSASLFNEKYGRLKEAPLVALDRWIKENPKSWQSLTLRSFFHYRMAWKIRGFSFSKKTSQLRLKKFVRRLRIAALDATRAIQLNANNTVAMALMMEISRSMNSKSEQEKLFLAMLRKQPFHVGAHVARLMSLSPKWGGSVEQMLSFATKVSSLAPKESALPIVLAYAFREIASVSGGNEIYHKAKIWTEVSNCYEKLIARFPAYGIYSLSYAELAWVSGRKKVAKKYFEQAVRVSREHPLVLFKVAKYYLAQKRTVEAIGLLNQAIDAEPDWHEPYGERGLAYFSQNEWKKAAADYEVVQRLRPNVGYAPHRLGVIHRNLGQLERAIASFDKAIKVFRSKTYIAKSYGYRCNTNIQLKRFEQAVSDCSKAIELIPHNEWFFENRAYAYQAMGRMDKALSDQQVIQKLKVRSGSSSK